MLKMKTTILITIYCAFLAACSQPDSKQTSNSQAIKEATNISLQVDNEFGMCFYEYNSSEIALEVDSGDQMRELIFSLNRLYNESILVVHPLAYNERILFAELCKSSAGKAVFQDLPHKLQNISAKEYVSFYRKLSSY